jgi:hypothetical protein
VSQRCAIAGNNRDSFHPFREPYEKSGEAALLETPRRRPIIRIRIVDLL